MFGKYITSFILKIILKMTFLKLWEIIKQFFPFADRPCNQKCLFSSLSTPNLLTVRWNLYYNLHLKIGRMIKIRIIVFCLMNFCTYLGYKSTLTIPDNEPFITLITVLESIAVLRSTPIYSHFCFIVNHIYIKLVFGALQPSIC